jgi:hypothetical protein
LLPVDDLNKKKKFLSESIFDLLVVCKRILSNSSKHDGKACTNPPNDPEIKLCNNEIDAGSSRFDPKKRRQAAYEP